MRPDPAVACVPALLQCAQACADYRPFAPAETAAMLHRCAEFCRLVAAFMSQGNHAAFVLGRSCAELCDECADRCAASPNTAADACRIACLVCAEACRRLPSPGWVPNRRTAAAGALEEKY